MRRRKNKARAPNERESLLGLGKLVVSGYEARLWWYHREIADALEGLLRFIRFRGQRGGYARVAISMPSRHGKSLHGVELLPALALGLYPDMRIMVGTNAAKLAKKGVRNTRRYMQSAAYMSRYSTRLGKIEEHCSDAKGRKVEAENTALTFRTLKLADGKRYAPGEGYYMAQGIGGGFIGEGFDLGIMDDLIKNAQQALSEKWLEHAWDFYTSTFDTRGDHPWAGQLYIGHRWTKPDFVDGLVSHWQSESTPDHPLPIKVICLPAIAEAPLEPYDPREEGEGLDKPEVRPRGWYEGKKRALMSRRPWVWFGMYQQRPTFNGAKFFGEEEWNWYNSSFQLRERLLLVDFSIDAAMGGSGGDSFTVIHVFGFIAAGTASGAEAGEHFFFLEEARGHWAIEEIYEQFERLWRKWTTALPEQFDQQAIERKSPGFCADPNVTRRDKDGNLVVSHARARIWCENKALGIAFNNRYASEAIASNVVTSLTYEERYAVSQALYPVPKSKDKRTCGRTAQQIVSLGRVWLPRESFGQDPHYSHLPLVDATPLGVVWEQQPDGKWKKVKADNYDGGMIHELGSFPSKPDDRRDTLAQEVICRTPWLGPELLAVR